jgi:metal-dependent amidase/aminoacylase/carboxypeptidase family protein
MIDSKKSVQDETQATVEITRELHRIPETAFCEKRPLLLFQSISGD